MKKIFRNIFALGLIAISFSINAFAQKDKSVSNAAQTYVISAKAGGVNYVEGNVTVLRKTGKSGYLLKKDNLEIGDRISTGNNGKAEILLNPGSYIRLAENSEFEFITTSLDDLKLKLTRGSAMLEVFADDNFRVIVNTPSAQIYAVKSGVYRIDVVSDGKAKVEVWEGKAQIGDTSASVVKQGREAVIDGNQVAVAKFDRDEKDPLEAWSMSRAKELAKVNSTLEKNILRNTLINGYQTNSWNLYNSFGLWITDASFSAYCFLPFGNGWYSPYGYYFDWNLWNIRMPGYIYNQPPIRVNPSGNGNGNGNGGNSQTDRQGITVRNTSTPPFEQIRDSGSVTTKKFDPTITDDTPSAFPSSQPSSPPVTVRPTTSAPTKSDGNKGDN
ncbi:MAG TPA: FecR family protein [Pyrinomonadaceae bacterium]|jgi:hypothetical protein